jgi:hypothetical protein
MTMFDPDTSWFEVVEIPNKRAVTCANLVGNTCASLVENTWLCCYPRPLQCIFDNGSEFLGAEFANTLDSYGIKHVPTTIKNPAANMVERVHQTLGNLLRVYELEEYEFLSAEIPGVIFSYLLNVSYNVRSHTRTISLWLRYAN